MRAQLMRHQVPLLFQQKIPSVDEEGSSLINAPHSSSQFLLPAKADGGLTHLLQGRGGNLILGEPSGVAKDAHIKCSDITRRA